MTTIAKSYRNVFGSLDTKGNLLPNNEILYGPYNNIDEAYNIIVKELGNSIPIGLTIGIKKDNDIIEYWFNGGIKKENLIIKVDKTPSLYWE